MAFLIRARSRPLRIRDGAGPMREVGLKEWVRFDVFPRVHRMLGDPEIEAKLADDSPSVGVPENEPAAEAAPVKRGRGRPRKVVA